MIFYVDITIFKIAVVRHLKISKFEIFHVRRSLLPRILRLRSKFRESRATLPLSNYGRQLEFKNLKLVKIISIIVPHLISLFDLVYECTFIIFVSFVTDVCRDNVFHFSGRPPS